MSSIYEKSSSDDLFGTASFGGGGDGAQTVATTAFGTLDFTEVAQCTILGATAGVATAVTGAGAPVSGAVAGIATLGCLMAESID